MRTELAVVGGGPAGYSAAFRAADLGIETTLIEARPRLGGVCLLEGCIPSKALLNVGRSLARVEEAAEWGVTFGDRAIDVDAVRARKDKCIAALVKGLGGMAKRRKVKVIRARARFTDGRSLHLDGEDLDEDRVEFEHAVLCSGSRPVVPGPLRLDSDRLMTSQGALYLPDIPETLLVIGGAYVGLEMGTTYARLGSRVSIVEMLDNLMPGVDNDLVKPLHKRLEGLVEAIHLGTTVEELTESGEQIEATMGRGDETFSATFDRVLVAVGREPNSGDLGLEDAGVELDDKGYVAVDDRQRTSADRIFAAGDVTGEPLLAHKAFHEGHVAAEALAGEPAAFDKRVVPAVVFTDPEIAVAGLSEQQAGERGVGVKVGKFPWAANGRAHSLGRPEGLTKLLFDADTDRLVGAGLVGPEAGELIGECALAIEMGCRAADLSGTVHPHPTLGETIFGAAEVHLGISTEVGPKRR